MHMHSYSMAVHTLASDSPFAAANPPTPTSTSTSANTPHPSIYPPNEPVYVWTFSLAFELVPSISLWRGVVRQFLKGVEIDHLNIWLRGHWDRVQARARNSGGDAVWKKRGSSRASPTGRGWREDAAGGGVLQQDAERRREARERLQYWILIAF